MDLLQKSFTLVDKKFEEDEKFFMFEGYASTFGNIDRVGDICQAGCFTKSLQDIHPILLWQHKKSEPIGTFIDVHEDAKGLYVKAKMPRDDKLVKDRIIPQLKVGSVNTMSIGYSVKDWSFDIKDNEFISCTLKEIELYEISLVSIPANAQAEITHRDSKSLNFEKAKEDALLKYKTDKPQKQKDRETNNEEGNMPQTETKKKTGINDIKDMSIRELEDFFNDTKGFSKKASTFIASRLKNLGDVDDNEDGKDTSTVLTKDIEATKAKKKDEAESKNESESDSQDEGKSKDSEEPQDEGSKALSEFLTQIKSKDVHQRDSECSNEESKKLLDFLQSNKKEGK